MSSQKLFIGLDMGGTDIKATVTDASGKLLTDTSDKVLSLAADGPRRTVEQIKLAADKILEHAGGAWADVVAVGLDTPGPASLDGRLAVSPNLKHAEWANFPIRSAVETRCDRPVVYNNDGNAAGYWEFFRLYGDDPGKTVCAAILGTGVGGAAVIGGTVVTGARGYGGEFGHVRLPTHDLVDDGDVPTCGCGKKACAEAFVSVAALDHHVRKALRRPEWATHPLHQIPDEGRARALKCLGLAQQGDVMCQQLFDRQAMAVGLLFVQIANSFDPDALLVGGGLTESSAAFRDRFLGIVRDTFGREAFPAQAESILVDFCSDQDQAGCRGSALLARQYAQRHGLL